MIVSWVEPCKPYEIVPQVHVHSPNPRDPLSPTLVVVQQIDILHEFVASILFPSRPYLGYSDSNTPEEKSPIPLSFGGSQLLVHEKISSEAVL